MTGNLHVALALALGAQPAETDDELVARVYALARRPVPARRVRGDLRARLAAALTAPATETPAELVDRVYRLSRPRPARRPRPADDAPTLLDVRGAA